MHFCLLPFETKYITFPLFLLAEKGRETIEHAVSISDCVFSLATQPK
jgi:hypothetical protein